jgi:transposase
MRAQRFDQPAMTQTFGHYLAVVEVRNQALDAVEADLAGWCGRPPFDWQVARLGAYRGITRLGALTLAAEVADWRRFAHAGQFMGFCGLVPSEYSSGASVHRGRLTKAGNAHPRAQLVESAWSYQHRPSVWGWPAASTASTRRSSPARGRRSSAWPPARTPTASSPRPSPGSSPGSCGPR